MKTPTPTPSGGALRSVAAAAVFLLSMTGLAVAAKPLAEHRAHVAERATGRAAKAEAGQPARIVLAWRGVDVDGDGAADFANPTGLAPRGHDHFGAGGFGARRDGGSRSHEGVDYAAVADAAVKAPISGRVTKIGYAYAGDESLRFVEISNPAIGYVARAFYVDPSVAVGDMVRLGDRIGAVVSLQSRYPGITDHVHLEVMAPSGDRVDATGLIRQKQIVVRG